MITTQFRLLILLVIPICSSSFFAQTTQTKIGKVIEDFTLLNIDNKMLALSDFSDAKGIIVVFTCNHCPFAKLYTKRFNDLNIRYKALKVPLIAINSMDTLIYEEERFALMQKKARKEHFNFPYLCDINQIAGKLFSAEVTPHTFVVWKESKGWVIRYSGAVDNNGAEPSKATPFVANAVDDLLLDKQPRVPETESIGCRIFYRNP